MEKIRLYLVKNKAKHFFLPLPKDLLREISFRSGYFSWLQSIPGIEFAPRVGLLANFGQDFMLQELY